MRPFNPKRDFAVAMLHAERLTRLLADELIAEVLLEQVRRHPQRRAALERHLERAEPRVRALHDEITTTGRRLLARLAGEESMPVPAQESAPEATVHPIADGEPSNSRPADAPPPPQAIAG
jgi:hypothetical protein